MTAGQSELDFRALSHAQMLRGTIIKMLKTARLIAQELFEENQNASLFEIRACTEAEVDAPDPDFVMDVVREYSKVKANRKATIRPAWQGCIVHLPYRSYWNSRISNN